MIEGTGPLEFYVTIHSLKKKHSLTLYGHHNGQMLLKRYMFILYGPKIDKNVIKLKLHCHIINLEAVLI